MHKVLKKVGSPLGLFLNYPFQIYYLEMKNEGGPYLQTYMCVHPQLWVFITTESFFELTLNGRTLNAEVPLPSCVHVHACIQA